MVRIKFIAIGILTHSFAVDVSADVRFQGLGDLPGGDFASYPSEISADGSTVVGYSKTATTITGEVFRWTSDTGMIGLGLLVEDSPYSHAQDISADGSVVVGFNPTVT